MLRSGFKNRGKFKIQKLHKSYVKVKKYRKNRDKSSLETYDKLGKKHTFKKSKSTFGKKIIRKLGKKWQIWKK